MKKNKTNKRIKKARAALLLMMLGWYVLIYPLLADRMDRLYNINTITDYDNELAKYSDAELEQMLQNCIQYNEEIAAEQKKQTFRYRGSRATDEKYRSVPIPNSNTIGSITIPKLGLNIAIVHGTSDSNLQGEIGHLYGTSLPIEGKSVHSVIAGHSALATAELFTHIDRLKKGDEFYITVLNKQYKYTVQSKTVCLPEEDWQYEQIEDDKNFVTLYTCTPYGINDHRLLVKGKLTKVENVKRDKPFWVSILGQMLLYAVEVASLIFAPIAFVVLWWNKDDSKKKTKKRSVENA